MPSLALKTDAIARISFGRRNLAIPARRNVPPTVSCSGRATCVIGTPGSLAR